MAESSRVDEPRSICTVPPNIMIGVVRLRLDGDALAKVVGGDPDKVWVEVIIVTVLISLI